MKYHSGQIPTEPAGRVMSCDICGDSADLENHLRPPKKATAPNPAVDTALATLHGSTHTIQQSWHRPGVGGKNDSGRQLVNTNVQKPQRRRNHQNTRYFQNNNPDPLLAQSPVLDI
jgi:hypothetical protein